MNTSLPISYEQTFDSVFVIESLAPDERSTGTKLRADVIAPALERNGMFPSEEVRRCESEVDLRRELLAIAAIVRSQSLSPIIQLECHGTDEGIHLSRGFVNWEGLYPPLLEINRASKNSLLLCSSMCYGGHSLRITYPHFITKPCAFWGAVGPTKEVWDADLKEGFECFYNHLLGDHDVAAGLGELRDKADGILLCIAENAFATAFLGYLDQSLDRSLLDERCQKLAALTGAPASEIRRRIAHPAELEQDYYRMRAQHLHINMYPEILDRFRLRFQDIFSLEYPGARSS